MNRYTAAGLIRDAMDGKTAIVLTPRRSMVSDALKRVVNTLGDADPDGYRVRRANGEERIEFAWGGRIHFGSVRMSLRGLSADVVFIDQEADRALSATERERLHANLAALGGEVITA